MKARELAKLGVPQSVRHLAGMAVREARRNGTSKDKIRQMLRAVIEEPEKYSRHALYGELAEGILALSPAEKPFQPREELAPFQIWGDGLDYKAIEQMKNAASLPVAVRGAMMPDAHVGYGLPIGGVLATRNSVIPYAVGVDIACRMKLTVLDMNPHVLISEPERLITVLREETRFGKGANFRKPREHAVMDEDWSVTQITRNLKDKAWSQLGTSGGGNHFVEFGLIHFAEAELGIEPGSYLALLSHSGSRGPGAMVANHYSKAARAAQPHLPTHLGHLAWLDLDSEDGQAYWAAMELMGHYAAANHACIHDHVSRALGTKALLSVENHHNFAWKETYDGEELIIHRKGATPAGPGVLGVIPGSMADPAFLVRGVGSDAALNSAAHGAGRRMSRKEAKQQFRWANVRPYLEERQVTLLSAGLDEVPMAYKNIAEVMAAQADLVEVIARFEPRLVKMADD
ncbi:MAG: RtcB family protein [Ardenticatenales bacterium]|nr:RtcB family protein [Ardenticatenales bacterium]